MEIGNTFLITIIKFVIFMLQIYMYIMIARALISWVNPDPYNPIVQFLRMATDPVLRFLRRYIPPIGGALDFTPIIVIFVIYFITELLAQFAARLAFGY
jgi:YggT family protein